MNSINIIVAFLVGAFLTNTVYAGDVLKSIFAEGSVTGNIRGYYNTRSYDVREDEGAFSLGGGLRAETGSLGIVKFGVGFYTAQDLGTNSSNTAKVNGRLGSDLEVLAESYVTLTGAGTALTLGRQKINSPFANPGDAFIIPFTFQGYSAVNKSLEHFTFQLDYLNEIKNRNSDEFVDVGLWISNRFGVTVPQRTGGTLNLGASYANGPVKAQAWLIQYTDFFNTVYLNGDYSFTLSDHLKPFVGLQFVSQSEIGDALVGAVDSTLWGVQIGAAVNKAKIILGYNHVAEQDGVFRNGAILAPFNYSTSPLFTNSMLGTLENVDAGSATKITLLYPFMENLNFKFSYAVLDFVVATDIESTDLDLTYSFNGYLKGLSLRWRVETITSDLASAKQTNHRLQTQFVF